MFKKRAFAIVVGVLATAAFGQAADARAAELFYGVDTQNRLVAFTSQSPTAIRRIAFTGLPAGE